MAELVDDVIRQMESRLEELRPLVREAETLETAINALQGLSGSPSAKGAVTTPRVETRRPRRTRAARSRRAPRGANRAAILSAVGANPGITVAQVSSSTGIAKPTVASTVSKLKRDGTLTATTGRGVALASGGTSRPAKRTKPRNERKTA